MRTTLLLIAISVFLATPVSAAEPQPGKIVEVSCKGTPAQTYSCYVPEKYDPKKAWPILYCFSPNARGDLFVQRYHKVCEERGWIVVGSMNSKNGPWDPIKAAIDAMWADTAARFSLSPTMRYATGFSGGARVSFSLAEMKTEITGVIAIGAGLHDPNKIPRKDVLCWLMCGEGDPNKREMDPLHAKLKKEGHKVEYRNFPGDHVMPEIPLLEEAVRWIDDNSAARKVERLVNALAEAVDLQQAGQPVKAFHLVTDALENVGDAGKLRKDAEKLLKSLQRDPAVKKEVSALKKYDSALKWVEKNRARIGKSDSVRNQAIKKLRAVVDKFPDTRAAERAEKRIEELEAG